MERVINALTARFKNNARVSEPMSGHTTFQIGGKAALFITPESTEDFVWAVEKCVEEKASFGVIGRGSNILFPDYDIDSVILSTERLDYIRLSPDNPYRITAGAGTLLKNLADAAYKNGLSGLEFACGIPGTLGGGLRMNAGAYGGDIASVFYEATVVALDMEGSTYTLYKDDMDFGYRHSAVAENGLIVLEAVLTLAPGDSEEIKTIMDQNMAARNTKQPMNFPSAGSVFKRPADGISAAKLIEECGLKGYSIGGAQVSPLHSGFIVNTGGATAKDVRALIKHIQRVVEEKTDIELEPEIVLID